MKASEVLKRYAAGRRDFSGENLRGQSFKGKDLSGADFSEADIRGANFTKAKLTGANFSGAKAGLQKRWAIGLVISSWILAGISGTLSGLASGLVAFIVDSSSINNVIGGSVALIMLAVFFIIAIRKGFVAGSVALAFALAVAGVVSFAFVVAFAFVVDTAIAGTIAGTVAGAVTGTVAGAFTVALAFAVTGTVAGVFSTSFAVACALICACAGAFVGVVAFAFAGAFARAFAVSFAVACAIAVGGTLLSAYISWRAIQGDEREAWIREVAIAFAATGGTSFRHADLTDADFTFATLKSTDLRQANLTRTCFHQTQKLDYVRPGITYIKDAQVRQLLITQQGQAQNFDRKNLHGVNLQGANLADASFIGADLSQANLQDTDLSRAKLVQTQLDYTDLTGATLTGACIEDWGITPETQLNGIQCDYVFMRLADNLDPNPRRKPDDWNKTFEDGEFADFIAPMVQTLDLYHNQVDDPRLIAIAFQQLTETHPDAELDIVSIEKRGKHRDKVLIRAETSPQANRSELHHDYFTTYNDLQALSPAALQQLLAEKDGQVKRFTDLLEAAIQRPSISAQTYYSQGDTMSESKGNISITSGDGSKISGLAGAGESITGSAIGEISGTVSVAINELPESPEPDKPGIKELLAQLQAAIEAESNLDEEDKAEALEQVKMLADAGKNPQEKGNQKTAKRATTMLKGIIVGLPTAATLFEAWNKVQPLITKLFGL
ncbi:pentapeptide repeat-containing protein [Coleofasciculus sp.]|uniref:pentapeptide repeat-containing protein n=1 Tax=Coleofasciculus sp. TaxID=3100458 RepID=UPI003A467454